MSKKQKTPSAATSDADAIQEHGWPSRRLKRWPIPVDFAPEPQKKRIGMLGYQKVVGAVRAMFTDAAMTDTLVGLQDYCFQQGGTSNANARDRVFFFDVLTHDLVFFAGDRERPIIEDLPLDPKIYDALPHMRASHYDLYRIESRGIAGGIKARSLLRELDEPVKAGVRPLRGPKKGDLVLGRIVQIGRGAFMDEPILSVDESWVRPLSDRFAEELTALRVRHPGATPESLLKVAGYHLYESVAALALRRELEQHLGQAGLRPVIVRFRVRKARDVPRLDELESAGLGPVKIAEHDTANRPSLVLVDLAPELVVHRSVREAMVSVEGREVLVVAFVEQGADALIDHVRGMLPDTAVERREAMTLDGTYRALRHVLAR